MTVPVAMDTLALLKKLHRASDDHKGTSGKVLVLGGASGMVGAALLSGRAALYAGAGMVVLGLLDESAPVVHIGQPELMLHTASLTLLDDINPDVIVVGPGMGQNKLAQDLLLRVLEMPIPVVIDADALNIIAAHPVYVAHVARRKSVTVITPHPGEAAKLLNITTELVQNDRVLSIDRLVKLFNAIVVLKGAGTLVATTSHVPHRCAAGNPGMASGGMGDVLTGIIAALIAQGVHHDLDAWDATCLGVELHAIAADCLVQKGVGPIGLTATELSKEVRYIINNQHIVN